MLARIQSDVFDKVPDWVFVLGGCNDIAAGVDQATIYNNLTSIYSQLHAAGIQVIGSTVNPSASYDTPGKKSVYATLKASLIAYAAANPWLWFADMGAPYDSGDGTPVGGAGGDYVYDAVHPTALGAAVMGEVLANKMALYVSKIDQYTTLATNNDPTDRLYYTTCNPLMSGTAGTVVGPATGTAADGWEAQVGGAWSKVARSDGKPGTWQQVIATAQQCTLSMFDITSGVVPGDTWEALAEFQADNNWVSPVQFQLELIALDAGSSILAAMRALGHSVGGGSGSKIINPLAGVLRTAPLTLPANTIKIRLNLTFQGSGTLRISRFEVRKA
jgi:hypothetical protein